MRWNTQLPNMKLAAEVLETWWICCFWDSAILTVYDNLMEGTSKWRVLFPLFSWSEWDVGNFPFWTSFLSGLHGNHVPNLGCMAYMLFLPWINCWYFRNLTRTLHNRSSGGGSAFYGENDQETSKWGMTKTLVICCTWGMKHYPVII